jgi:hypothetical protein
LVSTTAKLAASHWVFELGLVQLVAPELAKPLDVAVLDVRQNPEGAGPPAAGCAQPLDEENRNRLPFASRTTAPLPLPAQPSEDEDEDDEPLPQPTASRAPQMTWTTENVLPI